MMRILLGLSLFLFCLFHSKSYAWDPADAVGTASHDVRELAEVVENHPAMSKVEKLTEFKKLSWFQRIYFFNVGLAVSAGLVAMFPEMSVPEKIGMTLFVSSMGHGWTKLTFNRMRFEDLDSYERGIAELQVALTRAEGGSLSLSGAAKGAAELAIENARKKGYPVDELKTTAAATRRGWKRGFGKWTVVEGAEAIATGITCLAGLKMMGVF